MLSWTFKALMADDVEHDTSSSRRQFNGEDSVAREGIQNALDAAINITRDPVKVRFAIHKLDQNKSDKFRQLFTDLRPHLLACNIDPAQIDQPKVKMLVIEDFNTRGLTGEIALPVAGNFHDFWRKHGKTGKRGSAAGRFGLGKLVHSSASVIHSFFGLTVREGEKEPMLMGQAVLNGHAIGATRYVSHGFWFEERGKDDIQLPITNQGLISDFIKMTGVERTNQSGLSLVIPFMAEKITEDALIRGVVENYFLPILAGDLVVEVGNTLISAATFFRVVKSIKSRLDKGQWKFIGELSNRLVAKEPAIFCSARPIGSQPDLSGLFDQDTISKMKKAYDGGEIVHAWVEVGLTDKAGQKKQSFVDLFMKAPDDVDARPFALFARGNITVPNEAKNFSASAYGAFVAKDETLVSFLGDAENPAHTAWSPTEEKIEENWSDPAPTLKSLRELLVHLHSLVSDQGDRIDQDALVDFFALSGVIRTRADKKKRNVKPDLSIKGSDKHFYLRKQGSGACSIMPGPAAADWDYPKQMRVRYAYAIQRSDPFAKHVPFDFSLDKSPIKIEGTNVTYKVTKSNVMIVDLLSPDFKVVVSGFDENRDFVYDARVRS